MIYKISVFPSPFADGMLQIVSDSGMMGTKQLISSLTDVEASACLNK